MKVFCFFFSTNVLTEMWVDGSVKSQQCSDLRKWYKKIKISLQNYNSITIIQQHLRN